MHNSCFHTQCMLSCVIHASMNHVCFLASYDSLHLMIPYILHASMNLSCRHSSFVNYSCIIYGSKQLSWFDDHSSSHTSFILPYISHTFVHNACLLASQMRHASWMQYIFHDSMSLSRWNASSMLSNTMHASIHNVFCLASCIMYASFLSHDSSHHSCFYDLWDDMHHLYMLHASSTLPCILHNSMQQPFFYNSFMLPCIIHGFMQVHDFFHHNCVMHLIMNASMDLS